ncbi:unnamed protein product [Clonostachys byssicola]|uniref:Nucleoside phosphorylase domain-containing protein n=1 Tax=Clonostachys byssicola TaxID=160290 RepID=A0A9N9UC21_9HYPO|nr:unnamed protein product [Clonostachys byssicola]
MAAARGMLDKIHDDLPIDPHDSNAYIMGSIGLHNIVIACLGEYGTNNAAHVATHMSRSFPLIKVRLMVGIGGGAPSDEFDIRLGDIVVGRRIMQYDLGKITYSGKFERTVVLSNLRPELSSTISKLRAIHESTPTSVPSLVQDMVQRNTGMARYSYPQDATDMLFSAEYNHNSKLSACDQCDKTQLIKRCERLNTTPEIHYGAIASGNQVIKDGVSRDQIAQELKTICFEMEAAGLMDHFPCLVIRGICDYCDSHKNKIWQKYAAANAAAYAKEILKMMAMTAPRPAIQQTDASKVLIQLAAAERAKRRRELMDSLQFNEMYWRQSNIKSAHPVTCKWLPQHESYFTWTDAERLGDHHGFLWINGKPGSGKSTMMKFLSSQEKKNAEINTCVISFFFNARGKEVEKTTIGMYRSILFQLLERFPDLQSILDDSNLIPLSQKGCPALDVLQELFRNAMPLLGQRSVICYVDALDECDEYQARDMVEQFEDLCQKATEDGQNFRICFSSRHYPYIEVRNGIRIILEDQAGHRSDLDAYIRSRLQTGRNPEADDIHEKVLHMAAGVFMWVVLVVEILNKEFQRGRLFAVRRKLETIPDKLGNIFRDMYLRIGMDRQELVLCLQWILFAKRPLTPIELYYGILFGLSDIEHSEILTSSIDNLSAEKFVLSSSKGLAEVTKGPEPRVQFIHETVREFLLKGGGLGELLSLGKAYVVAYSHEKLKECCHAYLKSALLSPLSDGMPLRFTSQSIPLSWHALRTKITSKFPLTEYACLGILYHTNCAAVAVSQDRFVEEFELSDWITLSNVYRKYEARYPQGLSFRHAMKKEGYINLSKIVHESTVKVLHDAVLRGDHNNARAILGLEGCKATEDDSTTSSCWHLSSPPSYGGTISDSCTIIHAAEHGFINVVNSMIDSILPIGHGVLAALLEVPHHIAEGQFDILERLATLAVYDEPNSSLCLRKLLSPISRQGFTDIAVLLWARGMRIREEDLIELLFLALSNNHISMAKLLNAMSRAAHEPTALRQKMAAYIRNILDAPQSGLPALYNARELCLIHDIPSDIEYADDSPSFSEDRGSDTSNSHSIGLQIRPTALPLAAAEMGIDDILKFLIKKRTMIFQRPDGQNVLSCAARNLHESTTQLLVEAGADARWRDEHGCTPVVRALAAWRARDQGFFTPRYTNIAETAYQDIWQRCHRPTPYWHIMQTAYWHVAEREYWKRKLKAIVVLLLARRSDSQALIKAGIQVILLWAIDRNLPNLALALGTVTGGHYSPLPKRVIWWSPDQSNEEGLANVKYKLGPRHDK